MIRVPRIAATTRDIICSATSNADTDFKRFVRKEIARFEKEAEHYKILASLIRCIKLRRTAKLVSLHETTSRQSTRKSFLRPEERQDPTMT